MFLLGRRAHKHKGSSSHVRRIAPDVHEQCFDEFEEGPFIGETAGDVGANHAWADDVDYGGGAGYVSRTDVTRYKSDWSGRGKEIHTFRRHRQPALQVGEHRNGRAIWRLRSCAGLTPNAPVG